MVPRALETLDPDDGSVLFIENVGNLVCPALFDLGERPKVVVISVTEGDDKPLKYPHMFAAADLVVVNKTDLLPYVDFDLDRLTADARTLRPGRRGARRVGQGPATNSSLVRLARPDLRHVARSAADVGSHTWLWEAVGHSTAMRAVRSESADRARGPRRAGSRCRQPKQSRRKKLSSTSCGSTPASAVTGTPSR